MAYFTRFRKAATPTASVGTTVEVSEVESLAKGTMIIGDGSGAPTSLAIGDDDQVLTADSGEGSGVKWAAGTAATVTGGTQAAITSAANLVTVGTIGTGTWQGTTIAVNQGGTGVTSLNNLIGIAELAGIARGKIIVGDASGDPALLAAGSEDYVLTMDSNGDAVWAAAAGGGGARTDLTQDDLASYQIPITAFRKKARLDVVLDNSPGTPDLGTIDNTHGTAAPTLETDSQQVNGAETTHSARFQFPVPIEYVNGQTVTIRVKAGMRGDVATNSANVDVVCVRTAAANTDICATAAQSINNTTAANKDFTITPTNIVSGDILDVVVSTLIHDLGASSGIYGQIKSVEVLLDVKG